LTTAISHPSPSEEDTSLDSPAKPLAKRKFACPVCTNSFTTSGHLTRHNKIHSGDKPFLCPFEGCGKKTARQDSMTQHYRMHLPKPERTAAVSYVRARLDQERARRGWRVGQVRRDTYGQGPNTALFPAPDLGGTTSELSAGNLGRTRARAQPREPRAFDELSATPTYGSEYRGSTEDHSQSPRGLLTTPENSCRRIDTSVSLKPALPSAPDTDDPDCPPWPFANESSRYAISNARSE